MLHSFIEFNVIQKKNKKDVEKLNDDVYKAFDKATADFNNFATSEVKKAYDLLETQVKNASGALSQAQTQLTNAQKDMNAGIQKLRQPITVVKKKKKIFFSKQ